MKARLRPGPHRLQPTEDIAARLTDYAESVSLIDIAI
jgi:hypothetical protein